MIAESLNPTPMRYDAIVIGGGHNGLVARRLSGTRRPPRARARAPARAGRRGGHRGSLPRLSHFGLLLRRVAAAAANHPRARSAPPWLRSAAARRHFHADAGRQLPVAGERSRPHAARDPPAFAPRCRSLRRVRQGDDRHGALRQADARRARARSAVAVAVRPARAGSARPAVSIDVVGIALPARSAHDDERGRLSRSVVRDRRAESDDVGFGHHRHVSGCALARHGVRAAPPLHGRDRRRVPIVGIRERRNRRHFERHCGGGARGRVSRFAQSAASAESSRETGGRPAWCSRTATKSRRRSCPRPSIRA